MKHIKLFENFLFEGDIYQYQYCNSIKDPAEKAKCQLPGTSNPPEFKKFLDSQEYKSLRKIDQTFDGFKIFNRWRFSCSTAESKTKNYYVKLTYPLWLDEKGILCLRDPKEKSPKRTQEWIKENLNISLPMPINEHWLSSSGFDYNDKSKSEILSDKKKLEEWVKKNSDIATQSGDIFAFDLTKRKELQFPAKPKDILTKFNVIMGLTGYYQTEKGKSLVIEDEKEPVKKIFSNWTTGEFTPEFKELFNNRANLSKIITGTEGQRTIIR